MVVVKNVSKKAKIVSWKQTVVRKVVVVKEIVVKMVKIDTCKGNCA